MKPTTFRWTAAFLAILLGVLAGAGLAASAADPAGLRAKYTFEGKATLGQGTSRLGPWSAQGGLTLTFGRPDEEGRRRIAFVLDRLSIPDFPEIEKKVAETAVGKEMAVVIDANGRLVDFDLPIPPEMKEAYLAQLSASSPSLPATQANRPPVSAADVLRTVRPGTTISFKFSSPRPSGAGTDFAEAELTFAGPDASGKLYEIKPRVEADFVFAPGFIPGVPLAPTPAPAPGVSPSGQPRIQFTLGGTDAVSLENGLLAYANLESLFTFTPSPPDKTPAPADESAPAHADRLEVAMTLNVKLAEVEPLP